MKSPSLNHVAIALCLTFGVAAHVQAMSNAELKRAQTQTEADYKASQVPCASLSGNTKKICTVEAKGNEKIALANLAAGTRHLPKPSVQRVTPRPKLSIAWPSKSARTWPVTPTMFASRKPNPQRQLPQQTQSCN